MATATQTDLRTQVNGVREFLRANNVERDEEIELLLLAVISGVDLLFLGDPGTGKSYIIRLLTKHCIADAKLFTHLLAKDMSADEVLGPKDLLAYKEGRIVRHTEGFLPDANFAFLDEIFKSGPVLLNPQLDLIADRVLKMGSEVKDCSQLITILSASNELPEREDLQALRDRLDITKVVKPVATPEGRRRVTDIQLDQQTHGVDTGGLEPLTLTDIEMIRHQANAIEVPSAIRDKMGEAEQAWMEKGHEASKRRVGSMWKVVKAHAWMKGHDTVGTDDLLPVQHMAFNNLDDAKSAREVIYELATEFTRKAEQLRQALEPVMASAEALKKEIDEAGNVDDAQQLMDSAFKFVRELRKLAESGEEQIKKGEEQSEDVTGLKEIVAIIRERIEWVKRVGDGTEQP